MELMKCTVEETAGLGQDLSLRVIKPIVSALCHLNELGFAHCDVKSENILVEYRRDNNSDICISDVRLVDFDMYVCTGLDARSCHAQGLGLTLPL